MSLLFCVVAFLAGFFEWPSFNDQKKEFNFFTIGNVEFQTV